MAITRKFKKRFKGVTVKSGHIYTFGYQAWENDPKPVVIMMYALDGTHPRTKHQWRFFQAVNFTYIPRSMRRTFASEWTRVLERNQGDVRFTWEVVQRRYPYLKGAVRRYFFKPNYFIKDLKEVPFDMMEDVIVSTWSKDFSKKLKVSLLGKFRRAMRARAERRSRR
jgi:hypothetical protein